MNLGKINLITPPDTLFNLADSFLLVKPSLAIKQQFQSMLSQIDSDMNVFIFDENDTDIEWMLNVAQQVDSIVIDLDNCDPLTKQFATVIMVQPNVYYFTNDTFTPYNLINRNRIYDFNWVRPDDDEDEGLEDNE
jgi:hypothetical protein